jgi:fucose 4-O-acetylase-like acetyltransferase
MQRSQPFVDWMKAIGLLLIVYGHVAHASTVFLVPPIYIKQFGVTFFIFATAFTLARDSRPAWQVVINRLFEVYLFGIAAALLLSATWWGIDGRILPSNYLPLFGGANVVFNNFPANPTTWYIGTYVHLLLLWAFVLRGATIRPWAIAAVVCIEVPVRTVLAATAGPYVAYMALSNWTSVLLLGLYFGQRTESHRVEHPRLWQFALVGFTAAWSAMNSALPWRDSFPFMSLGDVPDVAVALLASSCTSFVYLAGTWLTFQATRGLARSGVVEFVARNTAVVFIVHMPIYYATRSLIDGAVASYAARVALRLVVCLVLLLVLSEVLHRLINLRRMRDALVAALTPRMDAGARVSGVLRRA